MRILEPQFSPRVEVTRHLCRQTVAIKLETILELFVAFLGMIKASEPEPVMNILMHKCVDANLNCSSCAKSMCSKCAQITPSGVRCSKCVPKAWQTTIGPVGVQAMMRLQVATVMLSLMLAKLLSIITPCIG